MGSALTGRESPFPAMMAPTTLRTKAGARAGTGGRQLVARGRRYVENRDAVRPRRPFQARPIDFAVLPLVLELQGHRGLRDRFAGLRVDEPRQGALAGLAQDQRGVGDQHELDRKSTRLNSSH